ncbi:MAG TPA: radical SAM protein [Pseudonocardiaceae bacterium]|nr:radical SAM protein [Pseudonocardiaceae bacterium]
MFAAEYCGECKKTVRPECRGSLSRAGVRKVHWECWSDCNLGCDFCYRTTAPPLDTADALLLLSTIKTGGVGSVVFAGGDPSLRRDLPTLVSAANDYELVSIVHTNAQWITDSAWEALRLCDHIGLSLDSDVAEQHDHMRGTRGNFRHVLAMLDRCDRAGVRVSVRTVVSAVNFRNVHLVGAILERYSCVRSWKLLEFTAVEAGWDNRARHLLDHEEFDQAFCRAQSCYSGSGTVAKLTTSEKVNAYMMIDSSGRVYGVTVEDSLRTGRHRRVASLMGDHLSFVSDNIVVVPSQHARVAR